MDRIQDAVETECAKLREDKKRLNRLVGDLVAQSSRRATELRSVKITVVLTMLLLALSIAARQLDDTAMHEALARATSDRELAIEEAVYNEHIYRDCASTLGVAAPALRECVQAFNGCAAVDSDSAAPPARALRIYQPGDAAMVR